jgi:diguanylate cyclase (GGDEF)-like protein
MPPTWRNEPKLVFFLHLLQGKGGFCRWKAKSRSIAVNRKPENGVRMWGIGLEHAARSVIRAQAGPGTSLRVWSEERPPAEKDLRKDEPDLVWIPWKTWKRLDKELRGTLRSAEAMETVLILEHDAQAAEVAEVMEDERITVMRTPLRGQRVRETVERAAEVRHLYGDIYRMAQEIYLERELLARKNEQLRFINRFLARATETLDPVSILNNALEDLALLLPVKLLQGVFWTRADGGYLEAELFLASDRHTASRHQWIELLLDSAGRLSGESVKGYRVTSLRSMEGDLEGGIEPPQPGRNIILPLKAGNVNFGCLVLLSDEEYNLGRDQVQMLQSALSHLGLALRNALLYREVKTRADYDGLTRVFNRKHFEGRLHEEVERHHRYGHQLSLLLLDLDHFKEINDTFGHQAGDHVLTEVGRLLQDVVRTTDYVARYGGEEFVVVLPHTDEDQAVILAERLRRRIADMGLEHEGRPVRVTASIGAATMDVAGARRAPDMVRLADQALYLAKAGGRNMVVCSHSALDEGALVQ